MPAALSSTLVGSYSCGNRPGEDAVTAARKPRSERLKARLRLVEAELKFAEQHEKDEILRRLAQNEQAYIAAAQERERYIKEVYQLPLGERPKSTEMAAAIGLTRQGIERIRDKK